MSSSETTRSTSLFQFIKNWIADAKIKEAQRLRRSPTQEMLDRATILEADAAALKGEGPPHAVATDPGGLIEVWDHGTKL